MEDAWGSHPRDQQLIAGIEAKLLDIGRDIQAFGDTLTHGDEAVAQAALHFERSFQTLIATFRTSVRKNISGPEMVDHPPVSSS